MINKMKKISQMIVFIVCIIFLSGLPCAARVYAAAGSFTTSRLGNNLKGTDKILYNKLKGCITEVAEGKSYSTEFKISLKDLGISDKKYSASDLGIKRIFKDGNVTADASDALYSIIGIDQTLVLDCLVNDFPYELYWFDKTAGAEIYLPEYGASKSGSAESIYFTSGVSARFRVSDDYSDGSAFKVDSAAVSKAKTAKSNAAAIVNKYASSSDYEKLYGYRKEICSLASYNTDAASGNVSYGNPWQLIWVFDRDPSTNVVCEGYAKAFQYLCDLTSFSSNVDCITVSGVMSGGTGAGSHAWNIVKMPDGNNYLVDIGNCDEGSVGADDKLFLAGTGGSASGGSRAEGPGTRRAPAPSHAGTCASSSARASGSRCPGPFHGFASRHR